MEEKKSEEKKEELNLEELKKQLEDCRKLKDEYLAGWQRTRADFLNYKKEELERIQKTIRFCGVELILKLLPILDNFDFAEKTLPENLKNDENVKGVLQIKTQILDFLKNLGTEPIESLGKKFDPNFHEVIEEVEISVSAPTFAPASAPASAEATAGKEAAAGEEATAGTAKDKESGIIIEEVQRGYKLNGEVIRPAKVRVTK